MSIALGFEYHYSNETQQYTFYRVPKVLIKDEFFLNISCEAKLLYGLMLDRLSLSLKNDWKDESNKVFIYYTLEDIQEDLNCAHGKSVKLLSELDNTGLIDRVKQGQGRPTKIYVKKFIVPIQNLEEKSKNQDFRKELVFEYHYGNEAQQYTFYRVPKVLIKDKFFKNVSCEAKLLYGFMLDRLSLSLKNDWKDRSNKVFIYYTFEDIQEDLNCAHGKSAKLLSELDNIGLIERVKQGQGRPTKIYVKKFIVPIQNFGKIAENQDFRKKEMQTSDFEKSRLPITGSQDFRREEIQTSDFEKSRLPITGSADFPKSESNYTYKNKTDLIDNNISQSSQSVKQNTDGQDKDRTDDITQKIEAYTELIKDNISYSDLAVSRKFDIRLINEFIGIMVDVILTVGKYVRINGEDKPRELVKHNFLKLDYGDMEHAIDQFKSVTERISKKKQYIISLLYNCKLEVDSHFTNLVKHDMYS